jgi:hypothetical protein
VSERLSRERSTIEALAAEFDPPQRGRDAEAANAVIAPRLQRALAGRLQSAPSRWFFEVVEPTEGT